MEENLAARQRLGERVKQLRMLRGLTQEQLAERVGNSPDHIGRVERGEKNVTIEILLSIAQQLSVHSRELFEATEDELEGKRVYVVTQTEFEQLQQAAGIINRMERAGA